MDIKPYVNSNLREKNKNPKRARKREEKKCIIKKKQNKMVAWNLNISTFTLTVSELNVPVKSQ